MTAGGSPPVLTDAADPASRALTDLEQLLRRLSDADLHRADTEGGWTVAQTVSHIHLCGLLWIADLEWFRRKQDGFLYREELGHDAVGAPPPSVAEAGDRIASARTALEQCLPAVDPAVLDKVVEIPTLGTMTVAEWMPLVVGHIGAHCDQIKAILTARGVVPAAESTAAAST